MRTEEQVRQGALRAIDKRIAFHGKRITDLTIEEYDSRGNAFLKRSPEVTSSERLLDVLFAARKDVAEMDSRPAGEAGLTSA